MPEHSPNLRILPRLLSVFDSGGAFHRLALRERLFLSQLPLNLCTLTAVGILAFTGTGVLQQPMFLASVLIIALVTVATLAVPWERLPLVAYLTLPLLDLVAVGLLHAANAGGPVALAVLSIFPVFWLAWSGLAPRTTRAVSFVGPLLIIWAPVAATGSHLTDGALTAALLWPAVTLALGVLASVTGLSATAQKDTLVQQEAKLQLALEESSLREQLLDTVLHTVNTAVLALDLNGETLLGNAPQQENHRRAAGVGVTTDQEQDLHIFSEDRVTLMPIEERPVARALRGESFSDLLVWFGTGEHQRAVLTSGKPINNDDGVREGAVVAGNDVTELVTALAAKDEFVANVSHELRTPLTSIIGYLDIVLDDADALPPGVEAALQTVARNSEKLLKLVSDLLATAANDPQLQPVPTDLAALVRSSVELAAPRAAAGEVTVAVEVPDSLDVMADPHRMGQVLDNLISNAIKYSPGGSVTVRAAASTSHIRVDVMDTGIGIAAADQAEVFSKFFRARTALTTSVPGVGLGLAITKGIVEAHGGTISLTSNVGAGSTFSLSLPTGDGVESGASVASGVEGDQPGVHALAKPSVS